MEETFVEGILQGLAERLEMLEKRTAALEARLEGQRESFVFRFRALADAFEDDEFRPARRFDPSEE